MAKDTFEKAFAVVTWSVDDITNEYGYDNHTAIEFLEKYEDDIQEAMVKAGWDAIASFVWLEDYESVANPTGSNHQP